MTTNLDLASIVAQRVQLRSIVLLQSDLDSKLMPFHEPEPHELRIGYHCTYELLPREAQEDGAAHIAVVVECGAMMVPRDDAVTAGEDVDDDLGNYLVKIEASFRLIYKIKGDEDIADSAYEHFAWLNGSYNAWPYWREYVQSSAARMGISSLIVPVFRPVTRTLDDDSDSEALGTIDPSASQNP